MLSVPARQSQMQPIARRGSGGLMNNAPDNQEVLLLLLYFKFDCKYVAWPSRAH